MMSVGERRGVVQNGGSSLGQKSKPSRLEAMQADLQSKILRDKEQKLMKRIENESSTQHKTLHKFRDHDSLSAPGGVRSFFQERRGKLTMPNSAGQVHSHQPKKKEGYDKSRPLQPITRNTQKPTGLPARGMSDPTLINSSKQGQAKPTDFQRWREEQDTADRQRRLNAVNRKNERQHSSGYQARLDEYEQEAAELRQLQEQEEIQRRALALQRKEEEREKNSLLKQKQEQKRLEQAERGRRRKEESERRQREVAAELERQKEAEQVELEQAQMIRQLEEQLKEKQRDLVQIQQRKPRDSPDYSTPQRAPHHISPEPPQYNSSRQRDYPASRATGADSRPSRNAKTDHPPHWNTHSDEEEEYIPPTKPKKVNRKEVKTRLKPQDIDTTSQPTQAKKSPQRSNSRAKPHELNSTYKVSRENSIPIATHSPEQLDPFVVDGEGLDINLAPCALCGRRFAEDRLPKHQMACKKSNKPRKQFNTTAQRIAGSGAEKFQYKQKQAQNKKAPKKDWRAQREEFVNALRYAKKAAAIEAKGGNVAELLPPPPKAENPDYVQCPHCNRKFNETAAERHIPKCKDIKAKPTMLKKRGRR